MKSITCGRVIIHGETVDDYAYKTIVQKHRACPIYFCQCDFKGVDLRAFKSVKIDPAHVFFANCRFDSKCKKVYNVRKEVLDFIEALLAVTGVLYITLVALAYFGYLC